MFAVAIVGLCLAFIELIVIIFIYLTKLRQIGSKINMLGYHKNGYAVISFWAKGPDDIRKLKVQAVRDVHMRPFEFTTESPDPESLPLWVQHIVKRRGSLRPRERSGARFEIFHAPLSKYNKFPYYLKGLQVQWRFQDIFLLNKSHWAGAEFEIPRSRWAEDPVFRGVFSMPTIDLTRVKLGLLLAAFAKMGQFQAKLDRSAQTGTIGATLQSCIGGRRGYIGYSISEDDNIEVDIDVPVNESAVTVSNLGINWADFVEAYCAVAATPESSESPEETGDQLLLSTVLEALLSIGLLTIQVAGRGKPIRLEAPGDLSANICITEYRGEITVPERLPRQDVLDNLVGLLGLNQERFLKVYELLLTSRSGRS